MKNHSQLPKDWCVKGIEARRNTSERFWGFTNPVVEPRADTYIKLFLFRELHEK